MHCRPLVVLQTPLKLREPWVNAVSSKPMPLTMPETFAYETASLHCLPAPVQLNAVTVLLPQSVTVKVKLP